MTSRDRILARRAKFLAAATVASGVLACSSSAEACLSIAPSETGSDTSAEPCLFAPYDSGREDTLDAHDALESGTDASETSVTDSRADAVDTGPMPCLIPPLDSGS